MSEMTARQKAVIALVILCVVGLAYVNRDPIASQIWPSPPTPPPVEITNLLIGDQKDEATAVNGSFTEISFDLQHNDGKQHTSTTIFQLTSEGIHYISITTGQDPGTILSRNQTAYQYERPIFAGDKFQPCRVYAWAHMKGLARVSARITVYLLVDGERVGDMKNLTLNIRLP